MRELTNLFCKGSLVPSEPDVYLYERSGRFARCTWMPVKARLVLIPRPCCTCCSPQQSWASRGEGLSYYLNHARSGPRPGACVVNGGSGENYYTRMQTKAAAKARALVQFCFSEWLETTVEEV